MILLTNSNLEGQVTEGLGESLYLQLKDIVIIGTMFTIAIDTKRTTPIHGRAMNATWIA
ncbi:MAG: hypothetical protein ACJAQ4_002177 [Cryomorphaceae bacterium]